MQADQSNRPGESGNPFLITEAQIRQKMPLVRFKREMQEVGEDV